MSHFSVNTFQAPDLAMFTQVSPSATMAQYQSRVVLLGLSLESVLPQVQGLDQLSPDEWLDHIRR